MKIYIGVDVGKYTLDICYQNEYFQVKNDKDGIKVLLDFVYQNIANKQKQPLVVCEATGGYEKLLVNDMRLHGIAIHIAHPNKIRAFAKSKGLLAKTDKIDSSLIRDYGKAMEVKGNNFILSKNAEKIRGFLKRRDQLLNDKHREQTRLDKELSSEIKCSIHSHVKWVIKEIDKIEKKIETTCQEKDINKSIELLQSTPAIGHISALTLIAYLPELGNIRHPQISALVGLAPFNKDSGCYKGKRFIQGGRGTVRKVLYMAAIASLRWNKDMQVFYSRLRSNGKSAKVAIVAVMRKLLIVLNSIMKRQTPWQDNLSIST